MKKLIGYALIMTPLEVACGLVVYFSYKMYGLAFVLESLAFIAFIVGSLVLGTHLILSEKMK